MRKMSDYKSLVEQYYPSACNQVWDILKQVVPEGVVWEAEEVKNFVVEVYDFTISPKRVGGAFIKRAQEVTLRKGDTFLKFLPAGMAWIGIYGKIELVTNKNIDNELLKKGIWFLGDEGKVFPVYPEKNEEDNYSLLSLENLRELLKEIF